VTSRKRIAIVDVVHKILVTACYLAKTGHDVTLIERRSRSVAYGFYTNRENSSDGRYAAL